MKVRRLLQAAKHVSTAWMVLVVLTQMLLISAAVAEDQSQETGTKADTEQIQIVADNLITNNAEKFAEFTGDVQASQGDILINSERLRVYYKDDSALHKNQAGSQESIKRIVASGNVRISSEKYTAITDRADYDLATRVLVLTGENSTVTSGENVLTGSKFIVYRKSGQIKVESSPQQRVKAVFYSKDKTADSNTQK